MSPLSGRAGQLSNLEAELDDLDGDNFVGYHRHGTHAVGDARTSDAYPFGAGPDDPEGRLASLFQAGMLDDKDLSVTTSHDLAKRKLQRMDVLANHSPQESVDRLIAISPLDPAAAQPFTRKSAWMTRDRTASYPLSGGNDQRTTLDPGPEDHDAVLFAPYQTTMWQNYTVTADLGGFTHPGDGTTAGLVALAGDPQY